VPEVFAQILTCKPKQPSWYQPQLDSAICSISLKAMAREATQRYKSMRDFGAALRGYLQGTSPTSPSGSGASAVAAHAVPRVPTTPPRPTAPAPTPERIDFACPKCGLLVHAPRATASKKGRCPNCGAIVPIEALGEAADATSPRHVSPSAHVPTQRFAPPQRIEFFCPHCHNLVRTPPGSACQKGRCPWCQRVVKIPRNDRERMHSSGDDFERLLQRMERSSIVTVSQLVGCSADEIKVLEERYGFRLPRSYVRYLRVMGHRSGRLCTRDHVAVSYSYVLKMTADLRRKWAACSSADDGRPPATFQLPTDALLITSRRKEQFEFIRCNGQDDSPVWYFNDWEWEIRQSHSSVLGWLECWCAEAERVITD
jgi:phage FluMu protein Com